MTCWAGGRWCKGHAVWGGASLSIQAEKETKRLIRVRPSGPALNGGGGPNEAISAAEWKHKRVGPLPPPLFPLLVWIGQFRLSGPHCVVCVREDGSWVCVCALLRDTRCQPVCFYFYYLFILSLNYYLLCYQVSPTEIAISFSREPLAKRNNKQSVYNIKHHIPNTTQYYRGALDPEN